MDKATLEQLKRIEILKNEAVKNEDFQSAKELKDKIIRLKNIGEQISLLESRKNKAIQKEDYDSAMVLKEEILRLRRQFDRPNEQKQNQVKPGFAELREDIPPSYNNRGQMGNHYNDPNNGFGGNFNQKVMSGGMGNGNMGMSGDIKARIDQEMGGSRGMSGDIRNRMDMDNKRGMSGTRKDSAIDRDISDSQMPG